MSWFKFWKKDKISKDSDNGISGPTFLDGFTEIIQNPSSLQNFEWRRRLISTSGNNKFKIKYYGKRHETYNSLIVETDFAPQKIIAIDNQTNEEILLFDGCKHGYNAMTWHEFTKEQIEKRKTENIYKGKKGNEIFEIIISAYYQIDYEDEFRADVDDNSKIKINNGVKIEFDELKRNGCDYLGIIGINESGIRIEILSEELS